MLVVRSEALQLILSAVAGEIKALRLWQEDAENRLKKGRI